MENISAEEKDEIYSFIFNDILDGIIIVDLTGKCLFANRAIAKMLELDSLDEIIGKSVFDFVSMEFYKKALKDLILLRKVQKGAFASYEATTSKGNKVWLEPLGKIINYKGKKAAISIVRDSTKRKEMELKLKENVTRLQAISESVGDLIYEWNIADNTLEWYGDIDKALGFEPGEFPRTINAWMEQINPEDRERLKKSVEFHKKTTRPIHEEYSIRKKDGSWLFWIDRGSPILDEKGKPYKWIGACIDITKQKKAEEDVSNKNAELENTIKLMEGREMKMIELKERIKELEKQLLKK